MPLANRLLFAAGTGAGWKQLWVPNSQSKKFKWRRKMGNIILVRSAVVKKVLHSNLPIAIWCWAAIKSLLAMVTGCCPLSRIWPQLWIDSPLLNSIPRWRLSWIGILLGCSSTKIASWREELHGCSLEGNSIQRVYVRSLVSAEEPVIVCLSVRMEKQG